VISKTSISLIWKESKLIKNIRSSHPVFLMEELSKKVQLSQFMLQLLKTSISQKREQHPESQTVDCRLSLIKAEKSRSSGRDFF
jgi:hypothetical protein